MRVFLSSAYRQRRIFVLVVSAAAFFSVLFDAPVAVRLAFVLPALFVCPGLALVGAIRLDGPATVLRLTIPVSAAISLIIAQTMLSMGSFEPRAGLAIICGGCALASVVDYVVSRWRTPA